jgi:hypothetical protein
VTVLTIAGAIRIARFAAPMARFVVARLKIAQPNGGLGRSLSGHA